MELCSTWELTVLVRAFGRAESKYKARKGRRGPKRERGKKKKDKIENKRRKLASRRTQKAES